MSSVTDATFQKVLEAPLAIVDFWAPTCPHCVAYKPVFEEVAALMGDKILMVTANTNENQAAAGNAGIEAIPTTIFYSGGEEVRRIEGGMSKADLLNEISVSLNVAQGGVAAPGGAVSPGQKPVGAAAGGMPVAESVALAAVAAGLLYLVAKA